MQFNPTPIPQLFLLDLQPRVDDRGFFARLWCGDELARLDLTSKCHQVSLAQNARAGTLRGMHYQVQPFGQAKMVRVVRGAIHDVVLDLRTDSPTYGRWFSAELSAGNRKALFVPEGCAHGYLTLVDDSEVLYVIGGEHQPQAERGVHWNSPVLQGAWPKAPEVLSDRDRSLPPFALPLAA